VFSRCFDRTQSPLPHSASVSGRGIHARGGVSVVFFFTFRVFLLVFQINCFQTQLRVFEGDPIGMVPIAKCEQRSLSPSKREKPVWRGMALRESAGLGRRGPCRAICLAYSRSQLGNDRFRFKVCFFVLSKRPGSMVADLLQSSTLDAKTGLIRSSSLSSPGSKAT
jgi:hypothetical protein